MSGSPRKHLRRADEALRQALDTASRYPEARAELVAQLGEERLAQLERAAAIVRAAVDALEGPADGSRDR
ncbi:MAG: hypothetical protein K2R93_16015 [Gemmatimonadaceae bacterium]|nr:hypothetical protein [Gemmatimonadaceae bacterium]